MRYLSLIGLCVLTACAASGRTVGPDGSTSTTSVDSFTSPFGDSASSIDFSIDSPVTVTSTTQGPQPDACNGCADFPATPQSDGTVSDPVAMQGTFGADSGAAATGGPCLVEPQDGTMFPYNWLRPRFRWAPLPGQTTFELRIHPPNQTNDLVVYTTNASYKMPADLWKLLAVDSNDLDISVTLRALSGTTVTVGARTKFHIAPVQATGAVVYWVHSNTDNQQSNLAAFAIGDEIVRPVLTPAQVQMEFYDSGGNPNSKPANPCVGCHNTTPDPDYVTFNNDYPWPIEMANVTGGTATGTLPAYLTPTAQLSISQAGLGMQALSAAHFKAGDRKLISTLNTPPGKYFSGYQDVESANRIAIFDLESTVIDASIAQHATNLNSSVVNQLLATADGTAWTYLPTGETHAAVAPAWSHDGNTVAYTSTYQDYSGRLGPDGGVGAIIKTVPYNSGAGGTAVGLGGANDANHYQYYPSFSPDDKFVAFNHHVKDPNDPQETTQYGGIYYMQRGEIDVTLADGTLATPIRLNGNDPATCPAGVQYTNLLGVNTKTTWQQTPSVAILPSAGANPPMAATGNIYPAGVWNTWPKWAPDLPTPTSDGRRFYWVVFSSARDVQSVPSGYPGTAPSAQLYMSCIWIDADNNVTTTPAVYIWNQVNMFNTAATDCTSDASTATDCYIDGSLMSNQTPSWDTVAIQTQIFYPPPVD